MSALTAFTRSIERYADVVGSFLTADPAAGVEVSQTVPAGQYWHLLGVNVDLVTSATVATRQVTLVVDDGVNTLARYTAQPTQAASLTYHYTWSAGAVGIATLVGTDVLTTLGTNLLVPPGGRIRTATSAIQGTDNYGIATLFVVRYIP